MRLNGTVKFFNSMRGFGFISPESGEKDVFVHVSALESSGVSALKEGDKVSFEIEDDPRGRGKQAAKIALS
jgi:CspA family cold shock protein